MDGFDGKPGKRDDIGDFQIPGRNGARLVRTQNIDACQSFDRLHFLYQGLLFGQAPDTEDKGNGSEQDQSFRDHADDAGYGVYDSGRPVACRQVLASQEKQPEGDDQNGNKTDNAPDGILHFRGCSFLGLRLFDQGGGIGIIADGFHPHSAGSCGNKAAGQQFVALFLPHGFGLSGEERFVDFQSVRGNDGAVRDQLVAGLYAADVAENDFVDRNLDEASGTENLCAGRRDDGQLINELLDAQLLDDADRGIGDHDADEQHIFDLSRCDDDDGEKEVQDIEIGDRMCPDDLPYRFLMIVFGYIDLAFRSALCDFFFRQAFVDYVCHAVLPARVGLFAFNYRKRKLKIQ